jgi:hypothetical protein
MQIGPFPAAFAGYVAIAQEFADPVTQLEIQRIELLQQLDGAPWKHRYAPAKWSIQELLGHIIDTERIFAARALRIARGDTTPLPGFDQDPYVAAAEADRCDPANLLAEFDHLRRSTVLMCRNFPDAAWMRQGTVSGQPISTRAMVCIILGHAEHHARVLRERYLTSF